MGYLENFANMIYTQITAYLTTQQLVWGALVLALLCIVLMIVIGMRNRKYQEALDTIDRYADKAYHQKQPTQERTGPSEREPTYRELIFDDKVSDSSRPNGPNASNAYQKGVSEAKAEAKKLISEAQDYVQDVKGRAEREYTEIVMHAQSEAKAIREMAEGILARSHETLRYALDRADRAINEASSRSPEFSKLPESVQLALDELAKETASSEDAIDTPIEAFPYPLESDGLPTKADAEAE